MFVYELSGCGFESSCSHKFSQQQNTKKTPSIYCLSVILIDFVFRTGKNYYPQVFLEEYKYVVREKKIPEYVTDEIEISLNSDKEDSDEETLNEGKSEKHFLQFFFHI